MFFLRFPISGHLVCTRIVCCLHIRWGSASLLWQQLHSSPFTDLAMTKNILLSCVSACLQLSTTTASAAFPHASSNREPSRRCVVVTYQLSPVNEKGRARLLCVKAVVNSGDANLPSLSSLMQGTGQINMSSSGMKRLSSCLRQYHSRTVTTNVAAVHL